MEEQNSIIPMVLLGTAVLELAMTPFIMARVKRNKLIVGFAMFSGALMTGGIGMAFWMGWI